MNSTKLAAIGLLILGSVLLIIGLVLYAIFTPPPSLSSVLILLGICIMIGAAIIMCIGVHTDLQASLQQIGAEYAP